MIATGTVRKSFLKHYNRNLFIGTVRTKNLMSTNQSERCYSKRLLLLRHGQATHNPRAEEARHKGCSQQTFFDLMKEDDEFDAPLTDLGRNQALEVRSKHKQVLENIDLLVSSPLSRAIMTADLSIESHTKKIAVDNFREISGLLLNARKRSREELESLNPSWDFSNVSSQDDLWKPEVLEDEMECSERGYQGLLWVASRSESNILVVTHGGILRFCMEMHPKISVNDQRDKKSRRFGNCELREYEMTWQLGSTPDNSTFQDEKSIFGCRPIITLTEIVQ